MGKFKDLTGMKFGRLTVLERANKTGNSGQAYWKCSCECGKLVIIRGTSLTSKHTVSCGCAHIEQARQRGIESKTHGLRHSSIYNVWNNIKQRCLNQSAINYMNYGGRGIQMYSEWIEDFQAFYEYVSKLEHFGEEGYSLDRIDNNGNYEPSNVRWADKKTQNRNKRTNRIVEYEGQKMTLVEASELSGVSLATLWARIKRGEKGEYLFRLPK